jgi:hypothetical protein
MVSLHRLRIPSCLWKVALLIFVFMYIYLPRLLQHKIFLGIESVNRVSLEEHVIESRKTPQESSTEEPFKEMDELAYIKVLITKCGELCRVGGGSFEDSLYFPKRTVPVDCKAIFSDEVFLLRGHQKDSAPMEIPDEYLSEFTLAGQVPVISGYYNQMYLTKTARTPIWERHMVNEWIALAEKNELSGTYGRGEATNLKNALMITNSVEKGRVLVIGSENPWVEATALAVGAREVVALEYGKITSEHPSIQTVTPDEFNKQFNDGTLDLFDAIVTFSSVEHSGLGRYGDALNPWGDVLEIARAHCVCKPNGYLIIAVPNHPKDALVFNAHRIYGNYRWPYLTSNWQQIHRTPGQDEPTTSDQPPGAWDQRIHVFQRL